MVVISYQTRDFKQLLAHFIARKPIGRAAVYAKVNVLNVSCAARDRLTSGENAKKLFLPQVTFLRTFRENRR